MSLPLGEEELAALIDRFYHMAVRGSISAVILLALEYGYELAQPKQESADDQA